MFNHLVREEGKSHQNVESMKNTMQNTRLLLMDFLLRKTNIKYLVENAWRLDFSEKIIKEILI